MSEPATLEPPLRIELRAVTKRFGAETALDAVTVGIAPGQVLGLLGENGAGKSTLMNVLFGLVRPDAGEIRVEGERVAIASPAAARALGIGMVHQHFTLAPGLTVAENFALDEGGWALLRYDRRSAEARVTALAATLGFRIDPGRRAGDLSVGDQQRAEILKALKGRTRVLVLDEPTATLTPAEVSDLFVTMRALRDAGTSIVFITHKLKEVVAITDTVVVLRKGRVVASRTTRSATAAELGALMVRGGEEGAPAPGATTPAAPTTPGVAPDAAVARGASRVAGGQTLVPRLEATGLVVRGVRRARPAVLGVDLTLLPGQIVAIAGVDGNGQTELAEALAGLRRPDAGTLRIEGELVPRLDARAAIARGVAYVPADRRRKGLVLGLSVEENLVLKHRWLGRFGRGAWLVSSAVRLHARERIERFGVRPPLPAAEVRALSGGNQQRVVLARELGFAPRLIVAESPTRGLDLEATRFVHERLREAAGAGAAVLVLTTDLDEATALGDDLFVMYGGRLSRAASRDPALLGALLGGLEPGSGVTAGGAHGGGAGSGSGSGSGSETGAGAAS